MLIKAGKPWPVPHLQGLYKGNSRAEISEILVTGKFKRNNITIRTRVQCVFCWSLATGDHRYLWSPRRRPPASSSGGSRRNGSWRGCGPPSAAATLMLSTRQILTFKHELLLGLSLFSLRVFQNPPGPPPLPICISIFYQPSLLSSHVLPVLSFLPFPYSV